MGKAERGVEVETLSFCMTIPRLLRTGAVPGVDCCEMSPVAGNVSCCAAGKGVLYLNEKSLLQYRADKCVKEMKKKRLLQILLNL